VLSKRAKEIQDEPVAAIEKEEEEPKQLVHK